MAASEAPAPSVAVLLRHGQREDYMALSAGWGEEWVNSAPRPWDPALAECGKKQAAAAAPRLRDELTKAGLPLPTGIYCSPLIRCVETADIAAAEFGVEELLVEQGIVESICENWMRQFAVPGATSKWGGGPADKEGKWLPVPEKEITRPEALKGPSALLRSPAELKATGGPVAARVAEGHESLVKLSDDLKWGSFEREDVVLARVAATVKERTAQRPGETLVFCSHGGPTAAGFRALAQKSPAGKGGMTALSILVKEGAGWRAVVENDASHAEEFHEGIKTYV